jgi:hypothetical protein
MHATLQMTGPCRGSGSRQPLATEARIQSQIIPCQICGGTSGTGMFLGTLVANFNLSVPPSFCLFVCLSVCSSVHMEQLGSHWADFHET